MLGILGIALPLLPTTPFLLLAGVCFAKSSPRLHLWLIEHKTLGPYLMWHQQKKPLSRRQKGKILICLWGGLTVSYLCMQNHPYTGFILLLVGTLVSLYVLKNPKSYTAKEENRHV